MPDTTPCVHCRRVGFVRQERIIKGGSVATGFYCGACDHAWTVRDHRQERRRRPRVIERARDSER
jgi:hypothetical protein